MNSSYRVIVAGSIAVLFSAAAAAQNVAAPGVPVQSPTVVQVQNVPLQPGAAAAPQGASSQLAQPAPQERSAVPVSKVDGRSDTLRDMLKSEDAKIRRKQLEDEEKASDDGNGPLPAGGKSRVTFPAQGPTAQPLGQQPAAPKSVAPPSAVAIYGLSRTKESCPGHCDADLTGILLLDGERYTVEVNSVVPGYVVSAISTDGIALVRLGQKKPPVAPGKPSGGSPAHQVASASTASHKTTHASPKSEGKTAGVVRDTIFAPLVEAARATTVGKQ